MTINDLLIDSKLGRHAKYALAFILACEGFVPISRRSMAMTMGITDKYLKEAMKELEEAGVIIVSNRRSIEIDWDGTERRFKCLSNSTEAQKTA